MGSCWVVGVEKLQKYGWYLFLSQCLYVDPEAKFREPSNGYSWSSLLPSFNGIWHSHCCWNADSNKACFACRLTHFCVHFKLSSQIFVCTGKKSPPPEGTWYANGKRTLRSHCTKNIRFLTSNKCDRTRHTVAERNYQVVPFIRCVVCPVVFLVLILEDQFKILVFINLLLLRACRQCLQTFARKPVMRFETSFQGRACLWAVQVKVKFILQICMSDLCAIINFQSKFITYFSTVTQRQHTAFILFTSYRARKTRNQSPDKENARVLFVAH